MSVEYAIHCDAQKAGCFGVIDASDKSVRLARESVREMGGKAALRGGRDICPNCVSDSPESGEADR